MSKMDSLSNLSPLNITVSRKVITFSDILAVNSIVGWDLLACSMKRSTSFLSLSKRAEGEGIVNVSSPFFWRLGFALLY